MTLQAPDIKRLSDHFQEMAQSNQWRHEEEKENPKSHTTVHAARIQRGDGAGGSGPPLKITKYRGFSNSGPNLLKNQSAFNVGPSSARQ